MILNLYLYTFLIFAERQGGSDFSPIIIDTSLDRPKCASGFITMGTLITGVKFKGVSIINEGWVEKMELTNWVYDVTQNHIRLIYQVE